MPDDTLKPALRTALRLHEIGDASPYRLFFAGKGKSGASFGFMQGDLAAGQPIVQSTFRQVLGAAGVSDADITAFAARLSVHLIDNPLTPAENDLIGGALNSDAGRPLIDAMDDDIISNVYAQLDSCVTAAQQANRMIAPKAQIYTALWINMTGAPNVLLRWLSGQPVAMARPVPVAPAVVDGAAMEAYLGATSYYTENPQNLPHMMQCAAAGMAQLGGAGG